MQRPVPVMDEKLVVRPNSDKPESQRQGKAIKEMLNTSAEVSSWDDLATARPAESSRSSTPIANAGPSNKTVPFTKAFNKPKELISTGF